MYLAVNAVILKSLTFQLFHGDERHLVFVLRVSVLGLISSMGLDGRKTSNL